MEKAATNGHLQVVKWLHTYYSFAYDVRDILEAIEGSCEIYL
jgi:hypothetical protein